MKMIVRRGTPWVIGVIAALVLLASVSSSTSMKLRKPRRKPTTRVPYQQSKNGPVLIKVIHKYSNDELTHGVSADCTNNICRSARDKFNFDIDKARRSEQDGFLQDAESLRYVVYPKRYEHFVTRKNTGHANRYKRNVALLESRLSNASDRMVIDRGDYASEMLKNENKGKFKKVTARKHIKIKDPSKSPSEVNRTRRDLDRDYLSRRNTSDYYAQRRAVMERYYARQREINARYANRTSNISGLKANGVSQQHLATSNATLFKLGHEYSNKDSTATFRHPSVKINPIYSNESRYNGIPIELPANRRDIVSETDLGFKPDADLSQMRSSGNIERNALDYYITPTPCTNISLSGTFAPKTRCKVGRNCTYGTGQSNEDHTSGVKSGSNSSDYESWGTCKGKVVYQHNLLLGLTGPSNLDAVFEVIIQGPVCITCVEALQYNKTRATVTLDSGGRGYEYAKLKLKGFENEGFSYIIKVWGIRKVDEVCDIN